VDTSSKPIHITVPANFEYRPYQCPFINAMRSGKYRYAILFWPRRHGKDAICFSYMLERASREKGNYAYIFPTASLARKAAWQSIDSRGFRFLDKIPEVFLARKLDNQMFVELKNGSTITFFGSDKQISVGTNYRGMVFSEFALQNPDTYFYLRPVINENKGWIVINTTARGKNHFYDLWNMAIKNPEWYTQKLTWKDAGVFTEADIQRERDAGMSEEMINSEYNCEFQGLEGSYYIRYIDKMRLDGRIGFVPYDSTARVHTSWDLGMGDSTAICFFQLIGNEIHLIDYYENDGFALSHYADILFRKPYIYDKHFAPHDIENRELSSGVTRKAVAEQLGIRFITLPTLKMRLEDGIETTRGMFPRLWINEATCGRLIKCLENYRKEYDSKLNLFKERPLHDWASDGADSFRYACIGIKHFLSAGSLESSEYDDLYRKYNPVF
jgi:phage terminase large subunit